MTLYTRPQLAVLLIVVLVVGLGLGVGQWRRTQPALAERLERLDRVPAEVDPPRAAPRPEGPGISNAERSKADGSRAGAAPRREAAPKRPAPAQPVDVNRADADELRSLPGIGAVLAERIVEAREREGPFASLDDLRRVRGLGRAKLERLAASIALGR